MYPKLLKIICDFCLIAIFQKLRKSTGDKEGKKMEEKKVNRSSLNPQLQANQNKNNCLVSNFFDKLKFPALFSVRNRWEKRAGDFNLSKKLLTRQLFLF